MCARAVLLRVTGVAVGLLVEVADDFAGGADWVDAFISFAGFAVTVVLFELFVAFLNRFGFFIVCPLHGTREPYACLERSKVISNGLNVRVRREVSEARTT